MRGSEFAELVAFVAVVEHGSFAKAASHLQMAPSSLSQTIKRLEERLGTELLHRTTRSVAMTGTGVQLFQRFRPAMADMAAAVKEVHESGSIPTGLVRLHLPRAAYTGLLESRLGEFHQRYPAIVLDAVIDDALVDLKRCSFDLDVRLAGMVDGSMLATAIEGPVHHVVIASPTYLAEYGAPATPGDLTRHRCIQWRRPGTEHASRWSFEVDGCQTIVDVNGPLTVSHCDMAVSAAVRSVGLAFVLKQHAGAALSRGEVQTVLSAFLPTLPGWSICHHRTAGHLSQATRAVIQFLTETRDEVG